MVEGVLGEMESVSIYSGGGGGSGGGDVHYAYYSLHLLEIIDSPCSKKA